MTASTARKLTVAELLAQHAAELTPSVGDKAYTMYRGYKFYGIITHIDAERGTGIIEPANANEDWGWHKGSTFWIGEQTDRKVRGLFFGYEYPSVYNVTEGMFHVIADAD